MDYAEFWRTVIEVAKDPKKAEKALTAYTEHEAQLEAQIEARTAELATLNKSIETGLQSAQAERRTIMAQAGEEATNLRAVLAKEKKDAEALAKKVTREANEKKGLLDDREKLLKAREGDAANRMAEATGLIEQNMAKQADLDRRLAALAVAQGEAA